GHTANAECTGCHMPKRRTDDAVHIVMTDHKIVRRKPPGNLLEDKPEKHDTPENAYRGAVALYYPDTPAQTAEIEMYLAMAEIKDHSNSQAGLRELSRLVEKYRPVQAGFYSALGEGYRAAGNVARAMPHFEEASRRAPASEIVWLQLGNALMELRQWSRAETA